MKKVIVPVLMVTTALFAGLPGCSTEPKTAEGRASLASEASMALDNFRAADPSVQSELDHAAGYAILPNIGKAGVGVGGAAGRGEVYEGGRMIGYCRISEGSIGLQAGIQNYSQLIVFRDKAALDKFKGGEWVFSSSVSAVAIKPGVAKAGNYRDGVAVFVHSKGGLMAEAAVGGQRVKYQPM